MRIFAIPTDESFTQTMSGKLPPAAVGNKCRDLLLDVTQRMRIPNQDFSITFLLSELRAPC